MLERLKALWQTKRKLCITGIAVVVAGVSYVVIGADVDIAELTDKICGLFGGC